MSQKKKGRGGKEAEVMEKEEDKRDYISASLSCLYHKDMVEKQPPANQEERLHQVQNLSVIDYLGLPSSKTVGNKGLLCKPSSLWYHRPIT